VFLGHAAASARQGAIQIADLKQVGTRASAVKAHAMIKLTFEVRLSYKQLTQIAALLLMFFHT